MLRRNCERLATVARVDGIYTTDSDGEFYAIELDEFRQLARSFGQAVEAISTLSPLQASPLSQTGNAGEGSGEGRGSEPPRVDAAMGVTWSSTQGVIDRLKAACDAGILNAHVAFPMFMPMARSDVDRFWEDLARAVPEARWIHYAHPRCGPTLTGADYARLAKQFPEQLIGTKLGTVSIAEITEIITRSPQLAHFSVDPFLAPAALLGTRGNYSYWVNTMPRWMRRYMDACLAGDWALATACHRKLNEWEFTHIKPIRDAGHLHGIISKARAALTGFLEDSGLTRAPYYPVPEKAQRELKSAFDQFWAKELAEELHPCNSSR
jgi:dihydrodipicolinate synthase/N-acetylneuraminate lyase